MMKIYKDKAYGLDYIFFHRDKDVYEDCVLGLTLDNKGHLFHTKMLLGAYLERIEEIPLYTLIFNTDKKTNILYKIHKALSLKVNKQIVQKNIYFAAKLLLEDFEENNPEFMEVIEKFKKK